MLSVQAVLSLCSVLIDSLTIEALLASLAFVHHNTTVLGTRTDANINMQETGCAGEDTLVEHAQSTTLPLATVWGMIALYDTRHALYILSFAYSSTHASINITGVLV